MATDVFVSVGRTFKPEQEAYVSAVEQLLRTNGLTPRTVGRVDFTSGQPLQRIAEVMEGCSGTVVLAFERTYSADAIEFRGTPEERRRGPLGLPTIWNQIEAAMAYVHKQPLLVIVENGVKSEGLLEARYDWYVQWITVDVSALNDVQFQGVFADWRRRVEEWAPRAPAQRPALDPHQLSVGDLVRSMKIPQLWGVVAALLAVLSVTAAVAFTLGQAASG